MYLALYLASGDAMSELKSIIQPRRIAYSMEVLYHFACGECFGWWSMSDDEGELVREFTCPHCKFSATVHLPEVTTTQPALFAEAA